MPSLIVAASQYLRVAVVIATHDREAELANRAIRSVLMQTRPPDFLVVIDDSDRRHRDANRRIVYGVSAPAGQSMRVKYLLNDRTPGLAGALNVGLDWLQREVEDAEELLVAILDDDDALEPDYLAACTERQAEGDFDLIATDLLRHEGDGRPTIPQAAPDVLDVANLLVRNPGIQGSNIFARLSTLLAAGLFDEGLASTTDRDLCIRVADLGYVRYARLAKPLVHHFADTDRPRLSTPGSPRKLAGLDEFYRKYRQRMTDAQRAAFIERGARLFGWSPPRPTPLPVPPVGPEPLHFPGLLTLIVGMTTSSQPTDALTALLHDLALLGEDPRLAAFDVVLLENGPRGESDGETLGDVARRLHDLGISALVVPFERQSFDANAGLFGAPFSRGTERVSIALARTMLQAYAYLWARHRPGAVVWILDDDMRLDNLVWRGGRAVERARLDVVGTLARLRATDVAIALGSCTEAPPLPFASCVRTQLVDAWHNFEVLAALDPEAPFPDLLAENMATRARFSDYYYDLSRRETDQLETPFWYVPDAPGQRAVDVFAAMVGRLPRILAGEEVFRPLVQDASIDPLDHLQPSVHRGGNAFVFDLEALWDFPNGVPRIGGDDTRRSDMVWSLLNRYGRRRRVIKLPLPVRQDRTRVNVETLDLEKLARDIHGYAIYSALDDLLLERCESSHEAGNGHLPDELDLTENEIDFATKRFQKYTRERLYAFQISFHRAAGLARSLARYLDDRHGWWWLRDARCVESVPQLQAAVEWFQREYKLERLKGFRRSVLTVDNNVVRTWLDTLRSEIQARKTREASAGDVIAWLDEQRAQNAAALVRGAFRASELRLLGQGSEGVALTDGVSVFKCFDAGRLAEPKLGQLRQLVGRWSGYRTLCNIREIRLVGRVPILVYDYENSTPYGGGRGDMMRLLLDECRDAGIVLTNVHPKNLIVTPSGAVRFIDYGCDIEPFSEGDWHLMARRVWLSARHPGHPDLKALMRRSLREDDLAELAGLEGFLAVDPSSTKESLLDSRLGALVRERHPRRVLDYGCGRAGLVQDLAKGGVAVTGYDPDSSLPDYWAERRPDLQLWERPGLAAALTRGVTYDVVVCSLVVCVIEDDEELARATEEMSCLVAAGGCLLVTICNPAYVQRSTHLQHREPPPDARAKCITWKIVRSSGNRRRDVHRPLSDVMAAFERVGFELVYSEETSSFDPATLDPSSDFLILQFQRAPDRRTA